MRGLHLVVEDIAEARAELVRRGVEIGEIQDFGGGVKGAGFSDPDGNTFELQEMAWRKARRNRSLVDSPPLAEDPLIGVMAWISQILMRAGDEPSRRAYRRVWRVKRLNAAIADIGDTLVSAGITTARARHTCVVSGKAGSHLPVTATVRKILVYPTIK